MDITRSCFEVWKNLPDGAGGFAPAKGQYYFLGDGAEFEQRSQLGGHWFEGHPFQTGEYATLDLPKPVWKNGAYPAGAEYLPDPHCCCGAYPEFTCTRAEFTVTRSDTGAEASYLASAIFNTPEGISVFKLHDNGDTSGANLPCPACNPSYSSDCSPDLFPAQIEVEPGHPDPDYVVSTYTTGPHPVIWPIFTACTMGRVRVRFFR